MDTVNIGSNVMQVKMAVPVLPESSDFIKSLNIDTAFSVNGIAK